MKKQTTAVSTKKLDQSIVRINKTINTKITHGFEGLDSIFSGKYVKEVTKRKINELTSFSSKSGSMLTQQQSQKKCKSKNRSNY